MNEKLVELNKNLIECRFNGNVLISKNKKIVFDSSYGYHNIQTEERLRRDSIMRIASITKTFTAIAILKLYEDGFLDLNDSISKYMEDFRYDITIHQVLSNSSGIANFSLDMDFTEILNSDNLLKELIGVFKDKELIFEPGTQFGYSISGYLILQYIIEKITGLTYYEYISKVILIPSGMNHTFMEEPEKYPYNRAIPYTMIDDKLCEANFIDMRIAGAGGGLMSTIEDIFKLDNALLDYRLLSKENTEKIFSVQVRVSDNDFYGYGMVGNKFVHNGEEIMRYYHSGGGAGVRSIHNFFRDKDVIAIIMSNLDNIGIFHKASSLLYDFVLEEL